jgi:predicted RNA binding protein YcfA (HicA-like mRNA interferase family)
MKGYRPDEIIKKAIDNGWEFSRKKSNHLTYKKDGCKYILTVPTHRQEVSRPISTKLLKQIYSN